MEPTQTLASQRIALNAVSALADAFPDLPVAWIDTSPHSPGRLTISLYQSSGEPLDAWEEWRSALGLTAEAKAVALPDRKLMAVTVEGAWRDAHIELIAFAPAPLPAVAA